MAFVMRQAQDSGLPWAGQAVPDATDFGIIAAGEAGNGIVSGLVSTVSSGTTPRTYVVTVTTGTYIVNNVVTTLNSVQTVTGTVASTGDRRDLISISGQVLTITAGTPCSVAGWTTTSQVDPPVKPAIPSNNVALASMYVPGSGVGWTTPSGTWLTDKSLVILPNNSLALSGGTMTGAIAMGGNKITGLAAGTASGEAVTFGQLPLSTSSAGQYQFPNAGLSTTITGSVGGTVFTSLGGRAITVPASTSSTRSVYFLTFQAAQFGVASAAGDDIVFKVTVDTGTLSGQGATGISIGRTNTTNYRTPYFTSTYVTVTNAPSGFTFTPYLGISGTANNTMAMTLFQFNAIAIG